MQDEASLARNVSHENGVSRSRRESESGYTRRRAASLPLAASRAVINSELANFVALVRETSIQLCSARARVWRRSSFRRFSSSLISTWHSSRDFAKSRRVAFAIAPRNRSSFCERITGARSYRRTLPTRWAIFQCQAETEARQRCQCSFGQSIFAFDAFVMRFNELARLNVGRPTKPSCIRLSSTDLNICRDSPAALRIVAIKEANAARLANRRRLWSSALAPRSLASSRD